MSVYHAVYLDNLTEYHLREKLASLYNMLPTHILELYLQGPSRIHILVSDHVSVLAFFCWFSLFLHSATIRLRYFVLIVIINMSRNMSRLRFALNASDSLATNGAIQICFVFVFVLWCAVQPLWRRQTILQLHSACNLELSASCCHQLRHSLCI